MSRPKKTLIINVFNIWVTNTTNHHRSINTFSIQIHMSLQFFQKTTLIENAHLAWRVIISLSRKNVIRKRVIIDEFIASKTMNWLLPPTSYTPLSFWNQRKRNQSKHHTIIVSEQTVFHLESLDSNPKLKSTILSLVNMTILLHV